MERITRTPFFAAAAPRDSVLAPDPAERFAALTEEALVADSRAGISPAQMVERKLASLLKSQPLPVSHLMTAQRNSRSH